MPFPGYVTTRSISIGSAAEVESARPLSLTAVVRASRSLTFKATGRTFLRSSYKRTGALGEELVFDLPVTDQSGWIDGVTRELLDVSVADSFTHTYTAKVYYYDEEERLVGTLVYGPFVLPTGETAVDLDTALEVGTVAADAVLIPNRWETIWEEMEAAADRAESAADEAAAGVLGALAGVRDDAIGSITQARDDALVAVGTSAGDAIESVSDAKDVALSAIADALADALVQIEAAKGDGS